jgi:hypothetical protein
MSYLPGDTVYLTIETRNAATNLLADADATPTLAVKRNGALDGAVTPTVAHASTGQYNASCVIPGTYASGDTVELVGSATVASVADSTVLFRTVLDGKRASDVYSLVGARGSRTLPVPNYDSLLTAHTSPTEDQCLYAAWLALVAPTQLDGSQNLQYLAADGTTVVLTVAAADLESAALAAAVLDASASAHDTSGTIGAKINAAGGAADPLDNAVPGSYSSGTAGFVIGTDLPALLTELGLVKAKTDALPSAYPTLDGSGHVTLATADPTAVAVATWTKLLCTGHVSAVTSAGSFSVVFDSPGFDGTTGSLTNGKKYLSFTSGVNHLDASPITGGTLADATHAAPTFTTPFGFAPQVNDTFALITN